MKPTFKLLPLLFAFFVQFELSASHAAGADVTYRCLGGDTFEIIGTLYLDCSGNTSGGAFGITLDFTSQCHSSPLWKGPVVNETLPIPNGGDTLFYDSLAFFYEVGDFCPGARSSSNCQSGGLYPGYKMGISRQLVVLPPCSTGWTGIRNFACCRGVNRNLVSSSMAMAIEIQSPTPNCNDGPMFTNKIIPRFCAGRASVYDPGIVDPEGDSLVVKLAQGFNTFPTGHVWGSPYTSSNPISNSYINRKTGVITFQESIVGNYIIVISVDEYDRSTGAWKGRVYRDCPIEVMICNNQEPLIGDLMNPGPFSSQVNLKKVRACDNTLLEIDIPLSDPDGDSVSFFSDLASVLPGASVSFSHPVPGRVDTLIAHVKWLADYTQPYERTFTVRAQDDICPVPAKSSQRFKVVLESGSFPPSIELDQQFCNASDTAQLLASQSGGVWSGPNVIDSIGLFDVGAAGLGRHLVFLDSMGFCGGRDSAFVEVVDQPSTTILQPPPFLNDGNVLNGLPYEVFLKNRMTPGLWSTGTFPAWMPFSSQALFVPAAVMSTALGPVKHPLIFEAGATTSSRNTCIGRDSISVFFCDPIPPNTQSYITTNTNGDLEAKPKGLNYWWYKNGVYLDSLKGDSILQNPVAGSVYQVFIENSICAYGLSDSNYYVGSPEFALESIQLLPNPASDEIFLLTEESYEEIELYDVEGKLLRRIQIDGLRTRIDLQGLNAGMYFLRIPSHPEKKALHFIKK